MLFPFKLISFSQKFNIKTFSSICIKNFCEDGLPPCGRVIFNTGSFLLFLYTTDNSLSAFRESCQKLRN
jgi:hypothetical protein